MEEVGHREIRDGHRKLHRKTWLETEKLIGARQGRDKEGVGRKMKHKV